MCEFEYAWDDQGCRHCGFPEKGRANWERCRQLHTLAGMAAPVRDRTWLRFLAAGCRRVKHLFAEPRHRAVVAWLDARAAGIDQAAPPDFDAVALRAASPRAAPPGPFNHTPDPFRASVARAVLLTGEAAGGAADVGRTALEAARALAESDGWTRFPPRALDSFPLPPELERYRVDAATLAGAEGRRRGRSRRDDSVARAFRILQASSENYQRDRADHLRRETAVYCDLLRDLVAYPFEPVGFDPSWRTTAVVGLATGMDVSGDFSPIPVLADALEDAGCADDHVLAHCRGDVPHAHGCWVVEHVLGRD
jgi:hypothetical protein